MRKVALLVLSTLFVALPATAGSLPAGGTDVSMPGFSVHSPGTPWLMREPVPQTNKDGSIFDPQRPGFSIYFRAFPQQGDLSSAYVRVTGVVIPTAARDVRGAVAEIKKQEEASIAAPSTRNRNIKSTVSEVTVNGNLCVRTEVTSEDVGVPDHKGEPFSMAVHGLMCPHPEFPSFVVSIEYSTRLQPGRALFVPDQDGFAVQNSLKFTPLGYRVTQIPIGEMAQMLTEADGSVWVAYGKDAGKVARIDPHSNAITAEIPVGKLPIGIAGDASGVWVANRSDNTVMQIDPKTNAVIKTVKVSGGPQQVAVGAGSIWVASLDGPVWRIDPETGTAVKIGGVGDQLASITVLDGQVYVAVYQSDRIVRIDPAGNKVVGTIKAARFASYLSSDGGFLWASIQEPRPMGPCLFCLPSQAATANHQKVTAVMLLNPALPDASPRGFLRNVGNMPRGLAMWRGKLWVANWTGASLSVLDPGAPDAGIYFPIGIEPVGVLAAQGSLWVTLSGPAHAVMRLDPE